MRWLDKKSQNIVLYLSIEDISCGCIDTKVIQSTCIGVEKYLGYIYTPRDIDIVEYFEYIDISILVTITIEEYLRQE